MRGAGNQGFVKSVNDANLMFEFLLNGLVIDHDNNVALRDEEMASMRQGRAFLALINDNIPKTAPAMEDLLVTLEDHENSLPQHRFERLILGTAYSAYQVQHQNLESEKKVWGNILGRLANATFVQLRKSS
ncbi:protein FAM180A [Chanos chanos]|uniref:Protein FAM180A n=1 Tax=Chanos chanos TaxID=29144 RepID=A0A6J2UMG5_CHACN|nr:protein FAM180A-like [Chanos chanos]